MNISDSTPKNYVIFDIETKNAFDFTKRFETTNLDVSVVCAYNPFSDEIETYWEDDMSKLEDLFSKADRIVGYNSWGFDEPVLKKYFDTDVLQMPSIDMLVAVKNALGTRVKLDLLAKATLGEQKTAKGLDAVKYWQEGRLDELEKYCIQDVHVTKELFYKGLNENKLSYFDGLGQKKDFEVDWFTADRQLEKDSPQQSMF